MNPQKFAPANLKQNSADSLISNELMRVVIEDVGFVWTSAVVALPEAVDSLRRIRTDVDGSSGMAQSLFKIIPWKKQAQTPN